MKNTFSGKFAYILGDSGRSLINFKDLGSKGNYFHGAEEIFFRDLGRSMYYFQGSREHRCPGRASLTYMTSFQVTS